MAKRLATAYVKTQIRLTEAEMMEFVQLFKKHGIDIHMRVYDNGSHVVVLEEGKDQEVRLSFEMEQEHYVFEGSCCFHEPALANAMRQAISQFRGSAIVHRQYVNFTMEYWYERGTVVRIVERRAGGAERVVYSYNNHLLELEAVFRRTDVEANIERLREEINRLLDIRRTLDRSDAADVDKRLADLSRQLFVLEA
ncbi:hypothetical protein PRECH8_23770 [Insulibacter thermoxylanivorax]|uniref:Non-ribosomal peptide synthetase module n=1 Tax=Insulibacter thermoxylanivorax TaxID=2749268 RepID=A0A916VH01_9BACL|nr:non-ribosomal peptide synthetase module [Insulibacter thermoxylanivorax]GFR39081.1 hypothetical protein PRECH8_23770 [Insulibacter thermoxylanivorax]